MKKLGLLLIIVLLFALMLPVTAAFAEENTEIEEVVSTDVEETTLDTEEEKGLKDALSVALAKVNELTSGDNYFKDKILPLIISNASTLLLVFSLFLRKYLKKKSKADTMEAIAASLQEENSNLNTLLTSSDPQKIQEALSRLFDGKVEELLQRVQKEFNSHLELYASLKTTIETEYAQLKNLIEAARQAWSSKPEVVALLANAPEKSTLDMQAQIIEGLKQVIYSLKGEEAGEIIKNLGA